LQGLGGNGVEVTFEKKKEGFNKVGEGGPLAFRLRNVGVKTRFVDESWAG
jgi:hypothetical protein